MTVLNKRKGAKDDCSKYTGIALLCTAGKILCKTILDFLQIYITNKALPESQCGFRGGRGTVDRFLWQGNVKRSALSNA